MGPACMGAEAECACLEVPSHFILWICLALLASSISSIAILATMNITTCNTFASRSGFPEYIELLRNATSSDFSLVSSCTAEICGALWGTGNPDISGVGMATGYLLESFVALGLCISSLLQQFLFRSRPNRTNLVLANASRTFFDTASLFTFSIQLACILTIAKADYGLGANGMGGTTKEITWLVSSLTLLPLALFILRPSIYQEDKHKGAAERPSLARRSSSTAPGLAEARQEYRIYTFVLCWGLAFYPFFSRMGNTFGKLRYNALQPKLMRW